MFTVERSLLPITPGIYLFKDQTDIAEKYLLNSLSLLQKRKKPSEIYIILENLGDLYIKKSQDPKQINNKQYKAKAYDYLRQSLKIMGKNSQENSSDFKRVKDKINKIKEL